MRAGFAVLEGDGAGPGEEPALLLLSLPRREREPQGELERRVAEAAAPGAGVPLVALLGEPTAADLRDALRAGAAEVLDVAVPLPELVARLQGRLPGPAARGGAGTGTGSGTGRGTWPEPEHDAVTGCATAGAMTTRDALEFERARRYALSFSVVRIDLDLDAAAGAFGADEAGDPGPLLAAVGEVLRGGVREPDFVARFGGSEFALILPETGAAGARATVSRLRAGLARVRLPMADGGGNGDGKDNGAAAGKRAGERAGLQLRLNAGIAAFPHPAVEAPGDLLALAEAALGRGRLAEGDGIGVAV